MGTVKPYHVSVPENIVDQLMQKLSLTTFPDELSGATWELGSPLSDVKRLTAYWRNEFKWRTVETKLNQLPNFQTSIQAEGFGPLNIHFVHQRSKTKNAIPLLFIHGWPGSFLEVSKMLNLLENDDQNSPSFHVVAPSIPNFGFSDGVKARGFALAQYAEVCHKLMQKLGYAEYVTQGGDWGSSISRVIAHKYPQACKASHLNLVPGVRPGLSHPLLLLQYIAGMLSPYDKRGLERTKWFTTSGMGYYQLQSTKPQTIGYALADSPVALLAWIYEKLHDWTDEYPWSDEEILTWVSLYWFSTAGPAASVRIYYETTHSTEFKNGSPEKWVPNVKLGFAYFSKEILLLPKSWTRAIGPVVYENENTKGGHFAAWENPEIIAGDLKIMFGRGGGAFAAVAGNTGYD